MNKKELQDGMTRQANGVISIMKAHDLTARYVSDGYHTFDELYYHRMILFSIVCNSNKDKAWKSWLHDDGEMFDDMFIVGIKTHEGQYTYHYDKEYWEKFDVKEIDKAPEWDGHKPEDITRLLSIDGR